MAELTGKAVSELPEATNLQDSDLLAISQNATSKKVTFRTLKNNAVKTYKTVVVNTDGSGDYTTISDAVAAASDGDIILVYPGAYFESVHAYNKLVHIKGIDKKTCVLWYHGKDYSTPPLEMAKGSVENLTIIALNSGTSGNANAYCVHIDNDEETGQSLYFRNVRFYNEIHQAVGIGLRHNFNLAFDDCEFEAISQAALYCHDWETADTSADKSGQKITCINCVFHNNSATEATIMFQSQELATNCATCKFVGCNVYNHASGGSKISMTLWDGRTLTNASFMGSSDWILASESGINTVVELNHKLVPYKEWSTEMNIQASLFGNIVNVSGYLLINSGTYSESQPILVINGAKPVSNNVFVFGFSESTNYILRLTNNNNRAELIFHGGETLTAPVYLFVNFTYSI